MKTALLIAIACWVVVQSDAVRPFYGAINLQQSRRHDFYASNNGRYNNAYRYDRSGESGSRDYPLSRPKTLAYYNKESPGQLADNRYSTIYRHDLSSPQVDARSQPAVTYQPEDRYSAPQVTPLTRYQVDVNNKGYRYRTVNDKSDVFVYFQSKAVPGTRRTHVRYDRPQSYDNPNPSDSYAPQVTLNQPVQINGNNGYQAQYTQPKVNFDHDDDDDDDSDDRYRSNAQPQPENLPYKQEAVSVQNNYNNQQQTFSYQTPVSQVSYSQYQPARNGLSNAQSPYQAPNSDAIAQNPAGYSPNSKYLSHGSANNKPFVGHSDAFDDGSDDQKIDVRFKSDAQPQAENLPYKQAAVPVQNNYNNQQQTFSYQTPASQVSYSQYQQARNGFSNAQSTYQAPNVNVNAQNFAGYVANTPYLRAGSVSHRPIETQSNLYDDSDDDDDDNRDDHKIDDRYRSNAQPQSENLPYRQAHVPVQNNYKNQQQAFSYQTPASQVSYSQYQQARNGFSNAQSTYQAPNVNVNAQNLAGYVANTPYLRTGSVNNRPIETQSNSYDDSDDDDDDNRDDHKIDDRYRSNAQPQSENLPYRQAQVPVQNNYNNQQQTFSYQTPASQVSYLQYQQAREGFNYARAPNVNVQNSAGYVANTPYLRAGSVNNRPIETQSNSYDDSDDNDDNKDDHKIDARFGSNALPQNENLAYRQAAVSVQNNYNNRQQTFSYQTPASQVSYLQYQQAREGFNYARAPNVNVQNSAGYVANTPYLRAGSVNNRPIETQSNSYDDSDDNDDNKDDHKIDARFGSNALPQNENLAYRQAAVSVQNNYNNRQQTFSYQTPASQDGYAQHQPARKGFSYAHSSYHAPHMNFNAPKPAGYSQNLPYLNAESVNNGPIDVNNDDDDDDDDDDRQNGDRNFHHQTLSNSYVSNGHQNYNNANSRPVNYENARHVNANFNNYQQTGNFRFKETVNPGINGYGNNNNQHFNFANVKSVTLDKPSYGNNNNYGNGQQEIDVRFRSNAPLHSVTAPYKPTVVPVQNQYNNRQQTFSYQTPTSQVSYSQYQQTRESLSNAHRAYHAPNVNINAQNNGGYAANSPYLNAGNENSRPIDAHSNSYDERKIDVRFRSNAQPQSENLPYKQAEVPVQNNYNNRQQTFSYQTPASQVGYSQYQPVRKGFSYAHNTYHAPYVNFIAAKPAGYAPNSPYLNAENVNIRPIATHYNSHDDDNDDDDDDDDDRSNDDRVFHHRTLSNSYANNGHQNYNYANSRPVSYEKSRRVNSNYNNNQQDVRLKETVNAASNGHANNYPQNFNFENAKSFTFDKPSYENYNNYGNAQPEIDVRNAHGNGNSNNGPQNYNFMNLKSVTFDNPRDSVNNYGNEQPQIDVRFNQPSISASDGYADNGPQNFNYANPVSFTYQRTKVTPNYDQPSIDVRFVGQSNGYVQSSTPTQSYETPSTVAPPVYDKPAAPVYETSPTPVHETQSPNYVTAPETSNHIRYDTASHPTAHYKSDYFTNSLRVYSVNHPNGYHSYGYSYGGPGTSVAVGFKSMLADNHVYKRNAGAFNESRDSYVKRRYDYDQQAPETPLQQVPYTLLQRPKGNADGPLSTVGEPFVLLRKPDLPDDKGRQEYKLPELTNINSKETALRLANVNKDEIFRNLYTTNPEAYGLINPAKYAPLNVLGLPHKFRFDHPLGNFNGFPPKIYHGNFDLPGPVVDVNVRRGNGQFNDQYKFQRIYDTHPGTDRLVYPNQGGPLNVIGLPHKFRYPHPNGNVNGFRPPEVPTNKDLPGPVVDVILDQPLLPRVYPLSKEKEMRFYSSQNAGNNYNEKAVNGNNYQGAQRRDDNEQLHGSKSGSGGRLDERLPLARYSQGPVIYKRIPVAVIKPSESAQKINYNHPMIKTYVAKTKQLMDSLSGYDDLSAQPFIYSRPPIVNKKSR